MKMTTELISQTYLMVAGASNVSMLCIVYKADHFLVYGIKEVQTYLCRGLSHN